MRLRKWYKTNIGCVILSQILIKGEFLPSGQTFRRSWLFFYTGTIGLKRKILVDKTKINLPKTLNGDYVYSLKSAYQ